MTCSARFSLISTSKPFHSSTRISTIGPCAFSQGQAPSPTPRNRGHGISYAGAWPPAPCIRCRISPWPLRCSFRSNVHQLRCLLLVVANELLQCPAEPFGLRCVVEMPLEARHLAAFLFICFRTLLPQVAVLLRVFLAGAALYHGVQFLPDHLAACYVHLSSLPVMAHGVVFPRGPKSVASVASDARTRCFCGLSTGISAGIRRMSGIRPCIIRVGVASGIRLIYAFIVLAGISGIICGHSSQGYSRACLVPLAARLDAYAHEERRYLLDASPQPTRRLRPRLIPVYVYA